MIVSFSKTIRHFKPCRRLISGYQVLGIESSCDDTSVAVVNENKKILGQGHFSQAKIHVEAGGILAHVAYYFHKENIKTAVEICMKESNLDFQDLNAIAVTYKPGLALSLEIGVEYAKALCKQHNKPLIPIHHMEAHALTGRLVEDVQFPFLVLLISGGHSILSYVESTDKFYTIGTHLDSSPGQAMDKVARRTKLYNLKKYRGMVGGAAIETAAALGDPSAYENLQITVSRKSCNFNFSANASKAILFIEEQEKIQGVDIDGVVSNINDICASFQWSLTRHICQRVEHAFVYLDRKNWMTENKCLVVSGGVASNQFIRSALKFLCDHYDYRLVVPPPKLCTDNGAMIAWNGIEKLKVNAPLVHPKDVDNIIPITKCPLGNDISKDVQEVLEGVSLKRLPLNTFLQSYKVEKEKSCRQ